jgi:FlaA1/EpsC-like NDP-sugar epimerase
MNLLGEIISWYFSRKALPYWCILIIDMMIVLFSVLTTFWVLNRTGVMFEERVNVLYTALLYVALSSVGAKVFHTYFGIVRYSSFIDLIKVAYANGLSLFLALITTWIAGKMGAEMLTVLSFEQTVIAFVVATLIMSFERIVVKSLYDSATSDSRALRVLIYGAHTGGIGLAKNIRSQNPKRFELCGFLSHDPNAKHIQIMGQKVYNVKDDIASIVEKEEIEAVLVSPLRIEDFRNNQTIQDVLIKAGVKIFMAQQVREASIKNGELTDEDFAGMQINEMSVEDLLPRSEIKVDMDSVGAMLTGKNVMITGSAGSIGSEMVHQIALFKPACMILIDQAETPQHDIMLMTDKYPDIKTSSRSCWH